MALSVPRRRAVAFELLELLELSVPFLKDPLQPIEINLVPDPSFSGRVSYRYDRKMHLREQTTSAFESWRDEECRNWGHTSPIKTNNEQNSPWNCALRNRRFGIWHASPPCCGSVCVPCAEVTIRKRAIYLKKREDSAFRNARFPTRIFLPLVMCGRIWNTFSHVKLPSENRPIWAILVLTNAGAIC